MEILFLGTCACDFSEKLKNEFENCFDKDARRSSAVLIDKRILIDCGPHVLDALKIANVDKNQITDLILTHLHDDHFDLENVQELAKGRVKPLRIWVRDGAEISIPRAETNKMIPHKKYEGEGFFITGVEANHDESACPQHLLIEVERKKLFYGCDGAWFLNKSMSVLKGQKVDFAVLDCTVGENESDYRAYEHNSIPMLKLMLPSLKTLGFFSDDTLIYLSHIAPSLHERHETVEKKVRNFGANLAYDGLKINL